MANLVVHFEIHASDPQRLIDFYSALLGWKFESYGGGEQPYWVIDTGEGAIGNTAAQPGLGINGGLTPRMIFLRGKQLQALYKPCYLDAQASAIKPASR